jgi:succinate dehydrogenase/fumarate reductase cytochrome b subunit
MGVREMKQIVFVRRFHRWSGLLLIIFVGLKMISGYSIAGNLSIFDPSVGYRIHYATWVDIPLLFLFTFHALYGILKVSMTQGITKKPWAFIVTTLLGFVIFSISLVMIYLV